MSDEIAEYQRLLRLYGRLNLYTIMSRLDVAERQLAEAVEVVADLLRISPPGRLTLQAADIDRRARAFIQKHEASHD